LAEEKPERSLEWQVVGTTLKVYLHLLKVKKASVREVYRSLGMSSPWLASYHLDRLEKVRLASKDAYGFYHAKPKHFGILNFFVVTGRWIVPRTFLYFLFLFPMSITFLILLPSQWKLVVFVAMLIPSIINLAETILFYRTLSRSRS
jgi:hypothetical protein